VGSIRSRLKLHAAIAGGVQFLLILVLAYAGSAGTSAAQISGSGFDAVHYEAQLEPDIVNKTVRGQVRIKIVSRTENLSEIEFECGDLTIDAVREGGAAQKFARRERQVIISLVRPAKTNETREIEIDYHGAPRRGIRFFPEQEQVYTVFATSQWLVCLDAPDKRATLHLNLILPAHLTSVANGRLAARRVLPGKKIKYEWRQELPVPTYTFGFAAGPFHTVREQSGPVQLVYLATQFSDDEVRRIFHKTADMIRFYEERAGVPYPYATYTQVLAAGGVEQEMSSFTAIRETYGREVLANDHAIWLGAHELAHQWWGNMLTCRDWTHFWLNEGMANFMTAAYEEHSFGRAEYLREIERYRMSYEKVRDAGKDRSLRFPDWQHPTAEDRTLVYDKGAYVLHLLRQELGEQAFWTGLRKYTQKYFGKSVETGDFQTAMEEASGRKLTDFFDRWVYLTR
jgi:aminopeptidase N